MLKAKNISWGITNGFFKCQKNKKKNGVHFCKWGLLFFIRDANHFTCQSNDGSRCARDYECERQI